MWFWEEKTAFRDKINASIFFFSFVSCPIGIVAR